MQAPIQTVQIGTGENIPILAFVVIIGGIGRSAAPSSRRFVGLVDTVGRAYLIDLLRPVLLACFRDVAPALPRC
jgi:hypothetical protein